MRSPNSKLRGVFPCPVILPNRVGLVRLRLLGLAGWKWFSTLVNWKLRVAPTRPSFQISDVFDGRSVKVPGRQTADISVTTTACVVTKNAAAEFRDNGRAVREHVLPCRIVCSNTV